mmetsp:Transcript_11851/g.24423  ORF Transcript_11851/g.24423 Transcript_11851/m.24423 type:complete len:146 (+) Transcript_11851:31-468(+)|eukprot:CAMPEP_0196740814 /NCGR_PEP_ID=MMETSP1091-20130531/35276_1 /TAXON_ID=302021 /ORGANISM="Rhodomonas sp., Strain CCMP768" /LENGTH=145 /DNA_ID=CAMNT_0042086165 /DNA_START=24 /DNA_END=461 /DNA_ORIENTATION=+
MARFWQLASGYLFVLAIAALSAVTVFQKGGATSNGQVALLQRPGPARKQALVYDSVTLGPYGSYDPVAWYFHDEASAGPEYIYQVPQTQYSPQQQGGSLLPYDMGDVIYQTEDLSNPVDVEEPEYEEAPWGTMDDVTFQVPISDE